ncbi:MAG: D-alanyl-lipoteichoic acid biosynthesis protein DltD [Clostridia bacterium]|nr:D-alanyl-lipoteichoic acid biosynthesis protein DltD [Clostridia bacterium]
MKKLLIIAAALVISLSCLLGTDIVIRYKLNANIDKATYDNNIYTRNCSDYAMERIIDEHSIVVLGSSELHSSDDLAYPAALFNRGYSDFNMVMMGAGSLQSLPQAINVGALANNIKNKKVVLIVSPQWFSSGGVQDKAFCSRFEETNYVEFLQNDDISDETKAAVVARVNTLLEADPPTLKRAIKYEAMYLKHTLNPVTYVEMLSYNAFRNAKLRYTLVKEFKDLAPLDTDRYVRAEEIDFDALLQQAEETGLASCTTNDFGVNDEYYNEYVRDALETSKNSNIYASYAVSLEYDDLRLFLRVCSETGIEPLIVSTPLNGRWYDYTGFPIADRNTYYQNIRNICAEFSVAMVDFSEKEYELYFLKDIMHLGWKGWAYLDRAVYSFYKGETIEDTTTYQDLFGNGNVALSDGVTETGERAYTFTTGANENSFNNFYVRLDHDQTRLDAWDSVGHRAGVYLHTQPSGIYTVRFRANGNVVDEYIDLAVYLEENAVYRVNYSVDFFSTEQIRVSDIGFSKVEY